MFDDVTAKREALLTVNVMREVRGYGDGLAGLLQNNVLGFQISGGTTRIDRQPTNLVRVPNSPDTRN